MQRARVVSQRTGRPARFPSGGYVRWVRVGDRLVKICSSGWNQSISVCTAANVDGHYECSYLFIKKYTMAWPEFYSFVFVGGLRALVAELGQRQRRQCRYFLRLTGLDGRTQPGRRGPRP